jgi:hypothetical protein
MLKELGNAISMDEKQKIKEDFQETLLSFCETVILNGARRGNEWNCAIFGLKGAAGWCAVRRWSEDRTIPDGQVEAATAKKSCEAFRRLPHRSRGQVWAVPHQVDSHFPRLDNLLTGKWGHS